MKFHSIMRNIILKVFTQNLNTISLIIIYIYYKFHILKKVIGLNHGINTLLMIMVNLIYNSQLNVRINLRMEKKKTFVNNFKFS